MKWWHWLVPPTPNGGSGCTFVIVLAVTGLSLVAVVVSQLVKVVA